jgi:hypothetical protein
MRALVVYLILLGLLVVSSGIGAAAAYWPHWCAALPALQWCAPG